MVRLPTVPQGEREEEPTIRRDVTSGELKILLIEDNPDVAASLRLMLEIKGHQVVIENDGPTGIERASTMRPDVIICDIGLPKMDGFAVAQAIRCDKQLDDRAQWLYGHRRCREGRAFRI